MSKTESYDLYKPLRNYLREVPLVVSLGVIRGYLQFYQFGMRFPTDMQVPLDLVNAKHRQEMGVYEWQLDILAKEIILNSENRTGKDLRKWDHFAGALNKLKDLEDETAKRYGDLYKRNILLELHRIAHRQFPWQKRPNQIWMTRYYKIFSDPEIDQIVKDTLGVSVKELYKMSLALVGTYLNYLVLFYPPELDILGIDNKTFERFIKHFSTDLPTMREMIKSKQSYDQDFAYSFNPLRTFPLIRLEHEGKDALMAPVPTYLFWRFTEGVYFEICNDPRFGRPFGRSFQNYVGEVLEKTKGSSAHVYPEGEYFLGRQRMDSVDWILEDEDSCLFIECKTKKIRWDSKFSLTKLEILTEDLEKMADAVVQIYKTIDHWKNGLYPQYSYKSDKKVFPLVVTLEEWYIFGDHLIPELDRLIRAKMTKESINIKYLEEMPYSVCSIEDAEKLLQITAKHGVKEVMEKKINTEMKMWAFQSFMFNVYKDEVIKTADLFKEDFEDIYPELLSKNGTRA